MATVRDYFDTDFSRLLKVGKPVKVWRSQRTNTGAELVDVQTEIHLDFDANAKFLSCYLPTDACDQVVIEALVKQIGDLLAIADNVETIDHSWGERGRSSLDLQFTGRFFIYHEANMNDDAQEATRKRSHESGVFLHFRGQAYATERARITKPLAFISHDGRDKDAIARPIAIALSKLMCPVWFDEFSLRVGDRLRESIERGLKEAMKCVLILTPHFIGKGGWTKEEFNGAFTRELVENSDVILPVWHEVTVQNVYEYSPMLANRFAVQWSVGVDEVARRLKVAIGN